MSRWRPQLPFSSGPGLTPACPGPDPGCLLLMSPKPCLSLASGPEAIPAGTGHELQDSVWQVILTQTLPRDGLYSIVPGSLLRARSEPNPDLSSQPKSLPAPCEGSQQVPFVGPGHEPMPSARQPSENEVFNCSEAQPPSGPFSGSQLRPCRAAESLGVSMARPRRA